MDENQDINTILVAVDFTPFSEEALCFAGKLADKLEAQLIVLHVIHDPAEAPGFYAKKGKKKEFFSTMEDVANEMMEEFLKCARNIPIRSRFKRPHHLW
jgi:nucleotide-binding universal stress UspA family protein